MEDRLAIPITPAEGTTETRKCSCCGKILPIDAFKLCKGGARRHTKCMTCEQQASGISEKFKDFTSRELMEELRNRGYKGTLIFTRVEEIKL